MKELVLLRHRNLSWYGTRGRGMIQHVNVCSLPIIRSKSSSHRISVFTTQNSTLMMSGPSPFPHVLRKLLVQIECRFSIDMSLVIPVIDHASQCPLSAGFELILERLVGDAPRIADEAVPLLLRQATRARASGAGPSDQARLEMFFCRTRHAGILWTRHTAAVEHAHLPSCLEQLEFGHRSRDGQLRERHFTPGHRSVHQLLVPCLCIECRVGGHGEMTWRKKSGEWRGVDRGGPGWTPKDPVLNPASLFASCHLR